MNVVEIILIAVGLAMDASAVSFAAAAAGYARDVRATFRLAFHFGLFQFCMPVLGWILGRGIVSRIASIDHWIAFGLLGVVGVRMIQSGMHPSQQRLKKDPSRGVALILLSIATSIDALAVGLSFAMLDVNIWYPSMVIGVITIVLSMVSIRLGNHLGLIVGKRMEIIGGMILIAIGFRIFLSHLFA